MTVDLLVAARAGVALVAVVLMLVILWDVFETIVLPRRASNRIRTTALVYRFTWAPWAVVARRLAPGNRRENFLGYYGPLAVVVLLIVWAILLIVGYASLLWATGSQLSVVPGPAGLTDDLYFSATTFFTLGLGDVIPQTGVARLIAVVEVANGFGLIALVIGYTPSLYQSFSRREMNIALLDARAGSPPSAMELLRRQCTGRPAEALEVFLREWERWSADILESHISYPWLCHFRSQHDNQSWVSSLTTVLDVCALILAGIDGASRAQARLTFAMARHAAVDLSQVLGTRSVPVPERLTPRLLQQIAADLATVGVQLGPIDVLVTRLAEQRLLYEPYVAALSEHLLMPLPDWLPADQFPDDWQTSANRHGR